MRLNINLATQAYEDARRFWWQWGLALVAVTVLTMGLGYAAVSNFVSAGGVSRQVRDMRAQIAERDREKNDAEAFLNRPENRETRDKSQFINALIARKAFSWTQVFTALEKIMPQGLQVVSIKPEMNESNQLELRMVVAGRERGRAVDLVRRLEESERFRFAQVRQETAADSQSQDGKVKFDISAVYVPEVPGKTAATEAAPASAAAAPAGHRGGQ